MMRSTAEGLLHPANIHELAAPGGRHWILDLGNSQHDDRQIAGNALRPQTGLRAGALPNDIRRGAQIAASEDDVAREALKKPSFAGIDAEVMQLHLGLGPSQRRCALIGRRVPMFIDAVQERSPGPSSHGPEGDASRGARTDTDTSAQGKDRIEHGPDRIG